MHFINDRASGRFIKVSQIVVFPWKTILNSLLLTYPAIPSGSVIKYNPCSITADKQRQTFFLQLFSE